jgi:hypothetical protein
MCQNRKRKTKEIIIVTFWNQINRKNYIIRPQCLRTPNLTQRKIINHLKNQYLEHSNSFLIAKSQSPTLNTLSPTLINSIFPSTIDTIKR